MSALFRLIFSALLAFNGERLYSKKIIKPSSKAKLRARNFATKSRRVSFQSETLSSKQAFYKKSKYTIGMKQLPAHFQLVGFLVDCTFDSSLLDFETFIITDLVFTENSSLLTQSLDS